MATKGINDNQLTITAGLSVGLIGKAKNSGKGMSSANIEKILLACPDLSPDWLLTGRGEMCKSKLITCDSPNDGTLNTDNKDKENYSIVQDNLPLISDLLDTIKEQAETIGRLKARIEDLERRIQAADDTHTEKAAG